MIDSLKNATQSVLLSLGVVALVTVLLSGAQGGSCPISHNTFLSLEYEAFTGSLNGRETKPNQQ